MPTCIGLEWPCATIAGFDFPTIPVHLVLGYLASAWRLMWMVRQALVAQN